MRFRLGIIAAQGLAWPYPGAAIDLDFAGQRYWWGGSPKQTTDFTTWTLNGSTFNINGLTPTATIDVTLSLSGLGTYVPGAIAAGVYPTGSPASTKGWCGIDDGTTNERVSITQNSSGQVTTFTVDGGVTQAAPVGGAPSGTTNVRHGVALSYALNDVKSSFDGLAGTADTVATMPTVTTLRIGKLSTASSQPTGALARVVAFTGVKTQAELNALAISMQTGA
jgi:hypothetical protein